MKEDERRAQEEAELEQETARRIELEKWVYHGSVHFLSISIMVTTNAVVWRLVSICVQEFPSVSFGPKNTFMEVLCTLS
jgi:hypothetical protein